MKSLYEISAELAPVEAALEASGGVVEGNEALVARLDELLMATEGKVDRIGEFYRDMELTGEAIEVEVKRLKDRQAVLANKQKRLKESLKTAMEMRGIKKVDGVKFSFYVAKNGGKAPMEILSHVDQLPEKFRIVTVQANLGAIRTALESGDEDAKKVAKLGEIGTHVRIK
jgi:hypothetical protein